MPALFRDASFWAVILGNALSIMMARVEQWDLGEIMLVYWSQSVIIGILNARRMWQLKDFTTTGLTSNGRPVPETEQSKRTITGFFVLHYGIFHIVYLIFICQSLTVGSATQWATIALGVAGFAGSHLFSSRYNAARDFRYSKPNLGTLLFYPYFRIVPMHAVIVVGGMLGDASALMLFMALKAVADAGMHVVEHRLFQKQ